MANKTHGTRQKMTFRVEASKPRNPVALKARQMPAGPHGKTTSAKRAADKLALKKTLVAEQMDDLLKKK